MTNPPPCGAAAIPVPHSTTQSGRLVHRLVHRLPYRLPLLFLIAIGFTTSTLLPRLPYSTLIDDLLLSAHVAIFLEILVLTAAHVMSKSSSSPGDDPRHVGAQRLLVHARWVFPLGHLLLVVVLARDVFGA